jgi:hypothetical protein
MSLNQDLLVNTLKYVSVHFRPSATKTPSLESIINASRVVTDRLDFLAGLELLIFNPVTRKHVLERRHLHRIVAEHTWIFGEEFNLSVSDRSLTAVLKKHLDLSELELLEEDNTEVLVEGDKKGIVDLMLSRAVPQSKHDEKEHLIVELKRPGAKITFEILGQVQKYATAIGTDERFKDTKTKRVFWALANDLNEQARTMVTQKDRPEGLFHESNDGKIKIWVKTWGQVIEDCRARLRFFQEKLQYQADESSALAFLQRAHDKYLPPSLRSTPPAQ